MKVKVAKMNAYRLPFGGGAMVELTTDDNRTFQMHGISIDEGMYIHSRACEKCKKKYDEYQRRPTHGLIKMLGLKDSIQEICITVGERKADNILYTAQVKTRNGKEFEGLPSSAIALALTQEESCIIYLDEDMLKEFLTKEGKGRTKEFKSELRKRERRNDW